MGVALVVGAAISAYGAVQQGKAAKAAGDYNAAVGRNNAILQERQAQDALARGKIARQEQERATSALMSRQRAVMAANGVLVDSGSALDIQADTAELGKFEELQIQSNAEREALGYRMRGMNFEADAGLASFQGASQLRASKIAATGTIVSSFGQVAGNWYGRYG